jgi:hypothetical protein
MKVYYNWISIPHESGITASMHNTRHKQLATSNLSDASSNLQQTFITTTRKPPSCNKTGGSTLMQSCQSVTSYGTKPPVNLELLTTNVTCRRRASVSGCQRLLILIFLCKTLHANEPATSLQLWHNSGSSLLPVL